MHSPFFFEHAFENLKHEIPASYIHSFSLDFAPFYARFCDICSYFRQFLLLFSGNFFFISGNFCSYFCVNLRIPA
jgi:hypothetical protein